MNFTITATMQPQSCSNLTAAMQGDQRDRAYPGGRETTLHAEGTSFSPWYLQFKG